MSQVRARPPKTKAAVAVPVVAVEPATSDALSARWLVAAASGLIAAWIASGSTGLLGHPLRHVLSWVGVIVAVLAAWPVNDAGNRRSVTIVGLALAVVLMISTSMAVNVLAVALVMASLAWAQNGAPRRALTAVAGGALMLGIYRVAYTSIPAVWYLADDAGGALGWLAGMLCQKPLSVGATFGGIDLLVAMVGMYGVVLIAQPAPRVRMVFFGLLAIVLVHLVYLIVLAIAPTLLPPPPPPPAPTVIPVIDPKEPFSLLETIRPLVPWNLPAVGALLHAALAVVLLRWTVRGSNNNEQPRSALARLSPAKQVIAATILAVLVPITSSLYLRTPTLEGKKIVLFEKGFLNWLKPTHGDYGRLSIGMYGMIPDYLRSLGAEVVVSKDLSADDLKGASVVGFFFPNKDWEPGQVQRVQKFVEDGGAMLVLGEHTTHEGKEPVIGDRADTRFNDLLQGLPGEGKGPKNPWTAMYVPFDSATFEIGGWLQSYEQMSHPTTEGIRDDRNQLGVVIGGSVKTKLPAEPFIIGRWGFNDPGDDGNINGAMMGNHRYDPGERLGDIVLAAEQRVGKGKVVAFGDTSGFTNGITFGAHVFTSRFWAYLADPKSTGHSMWRQALAILMAGGLLGVVLLHPSERMISATALSLAASLTLCINISNSAAEIVPDGNRHSPNNLAYITSCQLESSSEESWRADGTMGLGMNFMRNGYLTLALPEMTWERISRAAIVVCVGPQREFSSSQRSMIMQYVKSGGIFILTAGYDCHEASDDLVRDFGFYIGNKPSESGETEPPEPMGFFKSPYINLGDYMPHVRFHAAWPIGYLGQVDGSSVRIIANGPKNLPVMMQRKMGKGTFVLVGDTSFVMNKNLEWEDGRPFDGMRENADFWRWYLTDLTDQQRWIPPKPGTPREEPQPAPPTSQPGGGQ